MVDVSDHPDIADLYLAADVLVTDYSSAVYDFAVTGRPIVLYAPDLEHYRGMPPGFWEVYRGDPVSGVTLQRLTDRLDGGVVLRRGWFKTIDKSYSRSLANAMAASATRS